MVMFRGMSTPGAKRVVPHAHQTSSKTCSSVPNQGPALDLMFGLASPPESELIAGDSSTMDRGGDAPPSGQRPQGGGFVSRGPLLEDNACTRSAAREGDVSSIFPWEMPPKCTGTGLALEPWR